MSEYAQEHEYDNLDQKGQLSAAEIREQIGYESDGDNEDFTPAAIAARTGSVALQGYADIERQEWLDSMHLTDPSNKGSLHRDDAQGRQHRSEQINRLRGLIQPLRDPKGKQE